MNLSTRKRRLRKYGLSITKGLDVEPAIHLEILINNNCLPTSSFPLPASHFTSGLTKPAKTNSLSPEHDQPRSEKAVLFASDLFCLHRDSCLLAL